jgi:acetylglutamate kinase
MPRPVFTVPPTADHIADLAEQALARLPGKLARQVGRIGLIVDELPDDDLVDEWALGSAWELTGLYRSRPPDTPDAADAVHLFRGPILLEWIETGQDLFQLVRNVLIHEIAQHLGYSAADIKALQGVTK